MPAAPIERGHACPLVNPERLTMRVLLATLAVAGAIAAGCVPACAHVMTDERYSVAMMSASDVIRALRCPPPFGCKRHRSKPQRANAPFRPGGGLAAALARISHTDWRIGA